MVQVPQASDGDDLRQALATLDKAYGTKDPRAELTL